MNPVTGEWSDSPIALSNKFFEYSQARPPLIVSDVRTMAEMICAAGQGETRPVAHADHWEVLEVAALTPRRHTEVGSSR